MKIHEAIHLARSKKYIYFYNGEASMPYFFFIGDRGVWEKRHPNQMAHPVSEDINTHLKPSPSYDKDVWEVSNFTKKRGSSCEDV